MSTDAWFRFNETEVINAARTAHLAKAMGITVLVKQPAEYAWLMTRVGGPDYSNVANAPWYDAGVPASAEFAGAWPLSMLGLDDSTRESTPVEYVTDGGHSGKARSSTLSVVANVALLATTERGAEFGKRWLDRVLRGTDSRTVCSGTDLEYLRYSTADAPKVHRRNVRLSRGTSVTRRTKRRCSTTWLVTFTLNAADPYEYGEEVSKITDLGGAAAVGPGVTSSGTGVYTEAACASYNYSPIYDPLYPALVAAPSPPSFLPAGWDIEDGDTFQRKWARITPVEPSDLNVVPMIHVEATQDARMVRVSIYPDDSANDDQCDPLFAVVVSYLPANLDLYIDGEQQAVYVHDGISPVVRRADSLAYSPDANPVRWDAFKTGAGLLVTLDTFAVEGGTYQGGGTVRASLGLIPKSD